MDGVQRFLFNKFPREVGIPYRKTVYSERQFDEVVRVANHIKPVFVSVYPLDYSVDKVVIDIDSHNLFKAFESAKKLYYRLQDMDIDCLTIFSGCKGFHIYIPVVGIEGDYNAKKYILRSVQSTITHGIDNIDTHLFGDVRRLIRVPNTFNKVRYAVPLPGSWHEWDIGDILDYAKEPRHRFTKPRRALTVDIDGIKQPRNHIRDSGGYPFSFKPEGVYILLSYLVRPCIVEELMTNSNPPHFIRFNLVAELMWLGFKEYEVHEFIKQMNWDDYKPERTEYYINHIYMWQYYPEQCNLLRARGVKCTNCGWHCWWYQGDRSIKVELGVST